MSPFKVGVSRLGGSMSEGALPMLPAPPRPWERAPRTSAEERGGCSVRFLGSAAIFFSLFFLGRGQKVSVRCVVCVECRMWNVECGKAQVQRLMV